MTAVRSITERIKGNTHRAAGFGREMRVAFHTLGCKVNHYETEAIREAFVSRGAVAVGEDEPADVYIVNTCTVTNIADRKSRQYIRRMKKVNPDALIVVTGCYAQVEPDEVAAMPEVDMVVGNGLKSGICGLVLERLGHKDADDTDVHVLSVNELTGYEDMGIVASGEPGMTRAYVKIQEGCDRFCSYCLIPYARGPVRSRDPEEIICEVKMLVDSGIREVVLTGINTALYSTDPATDCGLPQLLERLDALEGDFRIRLSSLEPTVVDKSDVERIIRHRRLCHHLHLSVQNGSDRILSSMNRCYTRSEYLDIVRAIREFDPHYGITTDIIVGFSGETEDDFAQTLDIVRQARFGKVHVFRYSPRKGTAGAALPDAVPGDVKIDRSDRLEAAAQSVAEDFVRSCCGIIHTVLTEEVRDGYMTGYTDNYIKVYIPVSGEGPGSGIEAGIFCQVRLTEPFRDGCLAEIAGAC